MKCVVFCSEGAAATWTVRFEGFLINSVRYRRPFIDVWIESRGLHFLHCLFLSQNYHLYINIPCEDISAVCRPELAVSRSRPSCHQVPPNWPQLWVWPGSQFKPTVHKLLLMFIMKGALIIPDHITQLWCLNHFAAERDSSPLAAQRGQCVAVRGQLSTGSGGNCNIYPRLHHLSPWQSARSASAAY